jgi:plasmid maintenance system killer protein
MRPLEQVGAHEVLEAGGASGTNRPIQVVVLLLLLDGAPFRRGRRAGASLTCSVRQSRRPQAAVSVKDMAALPGNRVETLSGDRKGQYSIRINDQWRICFQWPAGSPGPVNVEIVDYH